MEDTCDGHCDVPSCKAANPLVRTRGIGAGQSGSIPPLSVHPAGGAVQSRIVLSQTVCIWRFNRPSFQETFADHGRLPMAVMNGT